MANITDVAAIKFSNEQIRPLADMLASLYYRAKTVVDDWNATTMSGKIPNTTDVLIDGAAEDGRTIINGIDATAIITRAQEFITDYEAGSKAKLNTVNKVAVNVR